MRALFLLLAFLGCALALPGLATYELGKKWGVMYPARRHGRVDRLEAPAEERFVESRHSPPPSRVDRLEAPAEERLAESKRRLRLLADRLKRQRKIDAMMDTLLGVRRKG